MASETTSKIPNTCSVLINTGESNTLSPCGGEIKRFDPAIHVGEDRKQSTIVITAFCKKCQKRYVSVYPS